jgi:hypothetical protein
LAFKSQVKWYEEGEKSSKYFLGWWKWETKFYNKISDIGVELLGQSNVMKCIRNFYSLLYKKGNSGSDNDRQWIFLELSKIKWEK